MRKFFLCTIIIFLVSNLAVVVKAEVQKGQKISDNVLKPDVTMRVNNNVFEADEESSLLHYKDEPIFRFVPLPRRWADGSVTIRERSGLISIISR